MANDQLPKLGDPVLEEVRDFAIKKIALAYGSCGVAMGEGKCEFILFPPGKIAKITLEVSEDSAPKGETKH